MKATIDKSFSQYLESFGRKNFIDFDEIVIDVNHIIYLKDGYIKKIYHLISTLQYNSNFEDIVEANHDFICKLK